MKAAALCGGFYHGGSYHRGSEAGFLAGLEAAEVPREEALRFRGVEPRDAPEVPQAVTALRYGTS